MRFRRLPEMRLLLAAALALWWSLAGCARLPVYQPDIASTEEVGRGLLHEWLIASGRHERLQGVAKVRVQTAERTVNATQVLLVEKPDRLRAEALSPFGTPLLVMASDGNELGVFLPGDNLFYSGRATPENIGRFTRLPLHPADLVNILLARPPVIAHQRLATFLLPEGGWRVELTAGARGQQLVFDASRRLREVRYLQGGELQLQLAYGEPAAESQGFPRRIDLDLSRQQIRASLVFEELATDRGFQPGIFTLAPPAGATIVRIDEVAAGERPDGEEPSPAAPQGPLAGDH